MVVCEGGGQPCLPSGAYNLYSRDREAGRRLGTLPTPRRGWWVKHAAPQAARQAARAGAAPLAVSGGSLR